MMKRIATLAALCVTSSITLAAVPAADPPLPLDIEQYESLQRVCVIPATDQRPEKTLVMDFYQRDGDTASTIITISLNDEKITQRQYGYDNLFQMTYFIFVKTSSQGNWTKFGSDELNDASLQLGVQLGLTQEELGSCDE